MYMMIALTIFKNIQRRQVCHMSRDTTTRSPNTRSTSPHQSWRVSELPYDSCASCVLVDVDDTLDSIFSSDMMIGSKIMSPTRSGNRYQRRAESVGSTVKSEVEKYQHTGVVPFLKKFESTVRCCTQNGIRGGSATVHFPIWHQEIEDIIVLKNNKGTEDNRVRKLDYSIQISKIFYERFITDGTIKLVLTHDVPGLYDAFWY